jgi:cytochrome c biogenesis protein CcdA/thiol-disulfide isomerase/thioredoxin
MPLSLVAFLGGALTIVSPCILPVLPFVFSRAGAPFRRSGLPLLAGMALTFAVLGTAATAVSEWVVQANSVGRGAAMAIFTVLGATLVAPSVGDRLWRPLVRLGSLIDARGRRLDGVGGSLLLGMSTGLLWTPCAGPILGLLLAGASVHGPALQTLWLLLSFALGAALMLALLLLASQRLLAVVKRYGAIEAGIRRGVGVAVLVGVAAIALGWDAGILTRVSLLSTARLEQRLVGTFRPVAEHAERVDRAMPTLAGAVAWLNTAPLTAESVRGKVVLVDFWTYSCINCLRSIPYVAAWDARYRSSGLVVIGVHSPEFAFEHDIDNVSTAVRALKLTYPIAIDNRFVLWQAFRNEYWPAHYVVDARGRIRHEQFGEGHYDDTERVIRQLLEERDARAALTDTVLVEGTGVQAAPAFGDARSPETYLGAERQARFESPQPVKKGVPVQYTAPSSLQLNDWGLAGTWNVGDESARLASAPGRILFRFHARDLHLVIGPSASGRPIRFRVRLDGAAPGSARGIDVDDDGAGVVTGHRLYQLIRQSAPIEDRTFEIEFLDPGAEAFAFTFG